ncbi:hypothetical protein CA262_08975 [Sphingobium sp. GW456-12-10-14-TSB1]|uniref:AAA family ATPase n=1 Tax=Sphingobium sp. GW456-12-10-14-TSB1 TaxID=1987165 RepID=UPI000A3C0BEE|nr:hypothetical protein CA262_08975 [Sphingobium sp. GW456-12-10-14-TSB1]
MKVSPPQDRAGETENSPPAYMAGVTARALMSKSFPPIQWIVRPVLVEGLTVFAGPPKLGKSWAMLGVALAVASGGIALGISRCEQGDVLYLRISVQ